MCHHSGEFRQPFFVRKKSSSHNRTKGRTFLSTDRKLVLVKWIFYNRTFKRDGTFFPTLGILILHCRKKELPSGSFSINYLWQHTQSNAHPNRGPKFFGPWFFFFASDLTNGERVNVQRQKPARHQKQILPPDAGESRRKVQNHDACAKEALLSCMSGSTVPSLMGNKLFDTTLCAFFFPPISIY